MQAPFEVKCLDLREAALAARALELQLAAHQLEAEWLSYPQLPLLWADLAAARACADRVWGAFEGRGAARPAGGLAPRRRWLAH